MVDRLNKTRHDVGRAVSVVSFPFMFPKVAQRSSPYVSQKSSMESGSVSVVSVGGMASGMVKRAFGSWPQRGELAVRVGRVTLSLSQTAREVERSEAAQAREEGRVRDNLCHYSRHADALAARLIATSPVV